MIRVFHWILRRLNKYVLNSCRKKQQCQICGLIDKQEYDIEFAACKTHGQAIKECT